MGKHWCNNHRFVSDTSDNISEFISEYTVDNTPPAAPVLKASSSELRVLLEWV